MRRILSMSANLMNVKRPILFTGFGILLLLALIAGKALASI